MDIRKYLDDFLPDKIFDAHMHLHDDTFATELNEHLPKIARLEDYLSFVKPIFKDRKVNVNMLPKPTKRIISSDGLKACDEFMYKELAKDTQNFGEIAVLPNEDEESILSRIKSDRIVGFKPYHLFNKAQVTMNLDIKEYLPESAFVIADKMKKVITLHLVKDESLADPENLKYIKEMAKKYPNAILILAHAARSFASWTGFETVGELKSFDNIWYDFSAVCESPTMFQIIKLFGAKKVLWGSDYTIACLKGKALSLADSFYWLYEHEHPNVAKDINIYSVFEENLLAVRQALIMADLKQKDIEDVFYNNAITLFSRK